MICSVQIRNAIINRMRRNIVTTDIVRPSSLTVIKYNKLLTYWPKSLRHWARVFLPVTVLRTFLDRISGTKVDLDLECSTVEARVQLRRRRMRYFKHAFRDRPKQEVKLKQR